MRLLYLGLVVLLAGCDPHSVSGVDSVHDFDGNSTSTLAPPELSLTEITLSALEKHQFTFKVVNREDYVPVLVEPDSYTLRHNGIFIKCNGREVNNHVFVSCDVGKVDRLVTIELEVVLRHITDYQKDFLSSIDVTLMPGEGAGGLVDEVKSALTNSAHEEVRARGNKLLALYLDLAYLHGMSDSDAGTLLESARIDQGKHSRDITDAGLKLSEALNLFSTLHISSIQLQSELDSYLGVLNVLYSDTQNILNKVQNDYLVGVAPVIPSLKVLARNGSVNLYKGNESIGYFNADEWHYNFDFIFIDML